MKDLGITEGVYGMSLRLDSLLNEYNVLPSILSRYFWQKTDGVRYPLPIEPKYLDLMKLALGLHIIEIDQLSSSVKEVVFETSSPDDFASIIDRLQSLFHYLTNNRITVKVLPRSTHETSRRLDENVFYKETILFSGGLDSLCGAITYSKRHPLILTHCKTNQVIFHKVLQISGMKQLRRSPLFCFDAMTKPTAGGISNTRGLLFLSLAYGIAASLGIKTILFCENGSQMLDVMLGPLLYPNKPATKNTNPTYIDYIEELLARFDAKSVQIKRPYKELTKAEMLLPLRNQIKFEDSFSCFTTRGKSAMCGTCYNCFMRRMSLSAINVIEDRSAYEMPPFEQARIEEQIPSYEERVRILFHVLRNYANILKGDSAILDEIRLQGSKHFEDPVDLAVRSAKDIFLGAMKMLKTIDDNKLNALGKKAKELLAQLDEHVLVEREEELKSASWLARS